MWPLWRMLLVQSAMEYSGMKLLYIPFSCSNVARCLQIIDASRKCSIHGDTCNVLKTRCVSRKNSIHFAQMCYDVFYCVMM